MHAGPDRRRPDRAARTPRSRALVEQRFRLFDAVGNAATVARLRAPFQPVLADDGSARTGRSSGRRSPDALRAGAGALEGRAGRRRLAAADVMTSFEARQLLLARPGAGHPQAKARCVTGALTALVRPLSPDPDGSDVDADPR